MKKTLAAILAAAMALSTATVAFAKDSAGTVTPVDGEVSGSSSTVIKAELGKTNKYRVGDVTAEDGVTVYDIAVIAKLISEKKLTPSVLVVSGANVLDGRPTMKAGNVASDEMDQVVTDVTGYAWNDPAGTNPYNVTMGGKTITLNDGDPITEIFVKADKVTIAKSAGDAVYRVAGKALEEALNDPANAGDTDILQTSTSSLVNVKSADVELDVSLGHTYGIKEVPFQLKLRFTAKDAVTLKALNGSDLNMRKGDTVTSEVLNFEAKYYPLDLYEDMQITTGEEVKRNEVLLKAGDLFNVLGEAPHHFSVSFNDDMAIYVGTTNKNDGTVNLYYNVDEKKDLIDEYGVEFQFLTFMASSTFRTAGQMIFDASASKETTIYKLTDDGLVQLTDSGDYDAKYKIVTLDGVKTLEGTYVISPVELAIDDDEPEEPAASAPSVEDPEDGNPNTGAC